MYIYIYIHTHICMYMYIIHNVYVYIYIYIIHWALIRMSSSGMARNRRAILAIRDSLGGPAELKIVLKNITGRSKKPNRTGRIEPNRSEPFHSGTGRNRTRKRAAPKRTEPRRVRKAQAEPHRSWENVFPNRTELNR